VASSCGQMLQVVGGSTVGLGATGPVCGLQAGRVCPGETLLQASVHRITESQNGRG